jgi:hypothetical protein
MQHPNQTPLNATEPIREGFNIYYNFIRPHMSLNGETPAERTNINLNLDQNRWLSLLQESLKKKRGNE